MVFKSCRCVAVLSGVADCSLACLCVQVVTTALYASIRKILTDAQLATPDMSFAWRVLNNDATSANPLGLPHGVVSRPSMRVFYSFCRVPFDSSNEPCTYEDHVFMVPGAPGVCLIDVACLMHTMRQMILYKHARYISK